MSGTFGHQGPSRHPSRRQSRQVRMGQEGSNDDGSIHCPIKTNITNASTIWAAHGGLQLSDDLHADELASYSPALHALRFAVMSQPAPELIAQHQVAPEGSPGAIMQKLLANAGDGRRFGEVR